MRQSGVQESKDQEEIITVYLREDTHQGGRVPDVLAARSILDFSGVVFLVKCINSSGVRDQNPRLTSPN